MIKNEDVRKVMGQMKKGLYNQSEDRAIQIPDQNAGLNTGSESTSAKTQNRQS